MSEEKADIKYLYVVPIKIRFGDIDEISNIHNYYFAYLDRGNICYILDMLATASTVQLEFGQIDNLSLRYNGTQLKAVEDNAQSIVYTGASDFEDGVHTTVEYTYDANGNTLSDANRGIETIVYNAIGLPYSITLADGSKITNTYDANGVLLRRVTTTPSRLPGLPGNIGAGHTTTVTEDRIGLYTYTGNTLSRIDTPMGYVDGNDSIRYYITDYQGNIRQVVNHNGEVLQDNHYYPFGMLMGESSDIVAANLPQGHFTDGGGNRFRYGAKELITTGGVNLSDYTARFLDHATLRFLTPDPLREKYTSMSSYLYCGANPVMFIDPTGMEFVITGDAINIFIKYLLEAFRDEVDFNIKIVEGDCVVNAQAKEGIKLTDDASDLLEIISNETVCVRLTATVSALNSMNTLLIGGAFMGNKVIENEDGSCKVVAYQEINPLTLNLMDTMSGCKFANEMHEITEAYQGAVISLQRGISAGPAIDGNSDKIYEEAHKKANPQSGVIIYNIMCLPVTVDGIKYQLPYGISLYLNDDTKESNHIHDIICEKLGVVWGK